MSISTVATHRNGAKFSPLSITPCPTVGQGDCIGHHGELFQGVLQTAEGRLQCCLLTLPRPDLSVSARFMPSSAIRHIHVRPAYKHKALETVRLTLDTLGQRRYGGVLTLSGNIPDARGYGASTADVVAAIRAVTAAFSERLSAATIAAIAVAAEAACDGLMFAPQATLFANREGKAVETYKPLPKMAVLGFDTAPAGAGIETLKLPPVDYSAEEIGQFQTLLKLLRQALHNGDIAALGKVASSSARINQRILPKAHFGELEAIAANTHAAGIQVAHSGTVAGLLYDASLPGLEEHIAAARSSLQNLGYGAMQLFSTQASV